MTVRLSVLLLAALLLAGCSDQRSALERVQEEGVLRVATRNSATTYYEGPGGSFRGLEHDLVQRFADRLGVEARFLVPGSLDGILQMTMKGKVDLAAAGLTVTPSRSLLVRFAPPYHEITQQLVYRLGTTRPRDLRDTLDGTLEVVAGSSHEEELERRKADLPELSWRAHADLGSEELLYLVREGVVDYTVADSHEVALNRRYYPKLTVAFDLTEPQPLAWAFPHSQDSSLYDEAMAFFEEIESDGTLAELIERYFGHVGRMNFVDFRTFRRHVLQRLPRLRPHFEQAAEENGIDWRLLAAIGYQESHWDSTAVSPTGVRGIMMLTSATAKQLGVEDRTDPEQSILGGARYVNVVRGKIPDRIPDPDRMWLALAAYNIGFGHLEDARILTERQGADPDKWADVKHRLPLLTKKKWHSTVRHGYARGREAATYVDNIRNYYDMLRWILADEGPRRLEAQKRPPVAISGNAL
jgi:membrane-bound lytic murein transglycosylase F